MGMFDWFEPDPPILCLKCRHGTVSGWQEKHSGHDLFLWRQSCAAPVDQLVDEEWAIPTEARARKRLPLDEHFSIYGGTCDHCGACFSYHLVLAFTGDTWTSFAEGHRVRHANEPLPGWLQCPECCNIEPAVGPARMAECPACSILLIARSPGDLEHQEKP